MKKSQLILVFLIFAQVPDIMASKKGLTIHDMLAMKRVGKTEISHDGKLILFSVKSIQEKNNKSASDLWLVELSSGNSRQLTFTPRAEDSYQWSPDDKSVIFSRDNKIWQQPIDGKKAKKIKTLPFEVETFKIAADGETFAFTARVPPACENITCQQDKLKQTSHSAAKIYTQLFVRHWDTWRDGLRSHLFVTSFKDSAEIVDVTMSWDADVPSTPFGGSEEYNFSADSKKIYFSSRKVGNKEAWSTNFDIFRFDLRNKNKPENLTSENLAWDSLPVESHDGKSLAYVAMSVAGYESDKFELKIKNLDSGETNNLTKNWNRSISEFIFTDDDSAIIVSVQDVGNKNLYRIDLLTGTIKKLTTLGKNYGISTKGKKLIYLHSDFKTPTEIYRIPITGAKPRQLTFFNKPLLAKIQMGDYQQFSFKGWNGEKVFGYMIKPINFNSKQKYPLVFLIHGGPQGSFYNQFHYRWNPQVYAAAGYVSVMIDFHGSTGYGQEFTDSIQNDWGGKPLEDLQKGLKAVSKRYAFVDTKNSCALGASYGGYMINWIAGQWNEQFKCLVNHDGVFDNRMMYFATEELWFPEHDNKGPYYDKVANYEKFNPVNYVKYWKTPMLVIQGGRDYRIPESQSLGAFTALQRQNIPSKFIYFPDENHWVLKPANAVLWHKEVLSWLKKYLK